MRPPKKLAHRSMDARRRQFSAREDAFARLWEKENTPCSWLNFGGGILRDLMLVRDPTVTAPWSRVRRRATIRNRDAAIVATVIQWLGTNVGWCFLETCLSALGKRITDVAAPEATEPREAPWGWIYAQAVNPPRAGRYVVRTYIGSFGEWVDAGNSEAVWEPPIPGMRPGIWRSRFDRDRPARIAWWWKPYDLHREMIGAEPTLEPV